MVLRYEINPPKVIQDTILSHKELQNSLSNIKQRIVEITPHCSGVHFTDSVLGIPRISPLTIGALTRKAEQTIEITASLRVRDRNVTSLTQSVCDAILLGLNGVLVLKGDAPPNFLCYGMTGTGKTATVRYISQKLAQHCIDNPPWWVYINCTVVSTPYRILAHIYNTIVGREKIPSTGLPKDVILKKLLDYKKR